MLQYLFSWHLRGAPTVTQVLLLESSVPKIRSLRSQHNELEVPYIRNGKYQGKATCHFFQGLSYLPLGCWEANYLSLTQESEI